MALAELCPSVRKEKLINYLPGVVLFQESAFWPGGRAVPGLPGVSGLAQRHRDSPARYFWLLIQAHRRAPAGRAGGRNWIRAFWGHGNGFEELGTGVFMNTGTPSSPPRGFNAGFVPQGRVPRAAPAAAFPRGLRSSFSRAPEINPNAAPKRAFPLPKPNLTRCVRTALHT